MYRGSRLAASFLLFLTGSAATAIGLGVVPSLVGSLAACRPRRRVRDRPLRRTVRNRPRPRVGPHAAVTIAESRGGISFAALIAIAMGANPFAGSTCRPSRPLANGTGLVAWSLAMYVLLGHQRRPHPVPGWTAARLVADPCSRSARLRLGADPARVTHLRCAASGARAPQPPACERS